MKLESWTGVYAGKLLKPAVWISGLILVAVSVFVLLKCCLKDSVTLRA